MPRLNSGVFYISTNEPPEVYPALVVRINADGTVDLDVFLRSQLDPVRVRNSPEGRTPHCWFDPFVSRPPTRHFP